jgi:cytosine/uracil/thiamine/allantoin permease
MSLQIFVAEFALDFLLYFLICFFVVYCIQNYLLEIKPFKIRTIVLWSLATIIIVGVYLSQVLPIISSI